MPDDLNNSPRDKYAHKYQSPKTCGPWCLECRMYDRIIPTAFLCGVLLFLIYYATLGAPLEFPTASLLKISPTESNQEIAQKLAAKHIIRSPYFFLQALHRSRSQRVISGEYFFPSPQSVITIAERLSRGDFELVPVKVTIPEGVNSQQISSILTNKIADFDTSAFLQFAQPKEGYLFPDTYFFLPGESATTVVSTMETNFNNHMISLATTTAAFNKPFSQVVIMASLLEKEASDSESRRIISGILWHRIALGMPLQVDAVFPYIIGRNTFQLTKQDLRIDSPFNTYTHKGLPPRAIVNPSLASIRAAETPIKTNFLFYLSDMQGNLHYSATYMQQLVNQKRYLQ